MLRALGQLLLRGAVSVGVAALTALCIAGLLSLIAASFQTKKQVAVVAGAPNGNACKPNHCRPKTDGGHHVLTAKTE